MEKIVQNVTGHTEIVDDRPNLTTFILPREVVESVNRFLTAVVLEIEENSPELSDNQMTHSLRIARIATKIALELDDELVDMTA